MSKYKKKRSGFLSGLFSFCFNVTCLVAIAGACYGIYQLAQKTEQFRVTTLQLDGLDRVGEQDVIAASGLTTRSNLLFIRSSAIAGRIEKLPGVHHCEVDKVFPDTLTLRITERRPVATLVIHNDMYEVDAEGHILGEIAKGDEPVWPLITDVPRLTYVEPGEALEAPELHEALDVWMAFRESETAKDVTVAELSARDINDVRMYCNELSYELRWGRGDYVRQARRLDVLWKRQQKVLPATQYVELRFGDQLACL